MSLEGRGAIGSVFAVGAAIVTILLTQLRQLERSLRGVIDRVDDRLTSTRTEVKQDVAELRTEFKHEMGSLRTEMTGAIGRLDERVYALAAGLKPDIERVSEQKRGA